MTRRHPWLRLIALSCGMLVRTGVQTCRINLCVSCTAFCNGRTSTIRHQEEKRKKKHKDEQDSKRNKRNKRKKRNKSKVSRRFAPHESYVAHKKVEHQHTHLAYFGMEMHSPTYKYKVIQSKTLLQAWKCGNSLSVDGVISRCWAVPETTCGVSHLQKLWPEDTLDCAWLLCPVEC